MNDNGAPFSFKSYAQIKIFIKDENDNEPQFAKKFYNLSINEWNELSPGVVTNQKSAQIECFGRIEAYDSDITQANSLVFYKLTEIEITKSSKHSSNHLNSHHFNYVMLDKNFFINQTTGDICVSNNRMLDRELRNKYEFLVTASNVENDAEIRLESSAILQINILDLNDNIPEFMQKSFIFYVSEEDNNVVNSLILHSNMASASKPLHYNYNILVGHIGAFDKDAAMNAELKYFTLKNDQLEAKYKSYFELNTENVDNPLLNSQNNIHLTSADLSEKNSTTGEHRYVILKFN